MALTSGTNLGPYEILGPLGTGGMGEVYRARDTRLDRRIAIKILPSAFSADSDHLRRFEQEARAASALNHPNIVTIYELGKHGSTHYIAMELVEGKTLRELITAGPLPVRRAIEIAAQVADGLAKAHEAGIAHRDLKPENLMVSEDGYVKILDFGLATLPLEGGEQSDMCATTQTTPGLLMGTVGYMSPEHASGRTVDFRSDQFSFGLVLYEMVTGKRAFQRATAAETLTAIIREQAEPIGAQNQEAPAPLCWAIERCMAKEPEKRYISTRDLAREFAALRDRFAERPVNQVETRPSNLPVQRTGFVGREKETGAAKELLLRKGVRLVTITGPGGIGKTRLALKVAGELIDHFPGGTFFVPLSSVNEPGLIASAIVQTLGIREAGGQSPIETLKKNLLDLSLAPTLLLLDNFEHVIQAAPTVADLLAAGPHLKIMVTSRSALHIYGEHEFPVPPLALPDSRSISMPSVEVLSQCPAVALFVQRALAAKPDFELSPENASAVAEICARLDGLPLAIELAAARVKVLSATSMLTRLTSRLQLLTGGARDLPHRQQTLRAAIDWSYDLLSPAEQKFFRRLSVFVGGCNLEGFEAVCNTKEDLDLDLLDGMASMLDKSLAQQIEYSRGETRFEMLETIREYALDKLAASGEEALTKRAHAAYCLVLAEEVTTEQSGEQVAEWLELFGLEHDNFLAALEWLTKTGDAEWGLRLGAALFRFWEMREFFAEGRANLGKLLKLAGAAAPTKARGRALFAAGVLAGEQGDYASATGLIGESQDIAILLSDKTGIAVALNALAVLARDRGDVTTAHDLFEASLEMWRELGDQKAIARALSNLANILKLEKDYDRARALYAECCAIFRNLKDQTCVAWSLNYQGDVARDQGDSAAAQALYEQGLGLFREIGDRWGIAGTLADLGNLAKVQQDYPAVYPLYRESITIFQELEHKRGVARVLECFASFAADQLQAERSLRLAGAAAALRQCIGAPLTPAEQVTLEATLEPARRALTDTLGAAAWLEGWALPVEKIVEEVLLPEGGTLPVQDANGPDNGDRSSALKPAIPIQPWSGQ
jgi:predicted ATPase